MSVFRPAVRVTGPDGREWEIYEYRFRLPRPRRLRDLPRAVLRGLRSDGWTVAAATFGGHREEHSWQTTREYRGQVLAVVEGSLAQGEFPVPPHARQVS